MMRPSWAASASNVVPAARSMRWIQRSRMIRLYCDDQEGRKPPSVLTADAGDILVSACLTVRMGERGVRSAWGLVAER